MTTKILVLAFLVLGLPQLSAQRDSVVISGIVYDYETGETLKKASFKHNGQFIDISEDGKFQLFVKPNDSLSFKYLGYQDYTIIVPDDLEKVAYISGIFLNKEDIEQSKSLIIPRQYTVESLATYDPTKQQKMQQNAQRNLAIAAYQATQPYEWGAHENTKYTMAKKDMEIKYKGGISPDQQLGLAAASTLSPLPSEVKIRKAGKDGLLSFMPLTPDEEHYLKVLFKASSEND